MKGDFIDILLLFILFNIVILYIYHSMNNLNNKVLYNAEYEGRSNVINMPATFTTKVPGQMVNKFFNHAINNSLNGNAIVQDYIRGKNIVMYI